MENTLYITGAGVSAQSGIPTFRGEDGYWTIGSKHYTPQEMATRRMYQSNPGQFLLWYYKRFATYRHHGPNEVHRWLADKNLVTQNIDGLDGKAGNENYIGIHGRLDQVTLYHEQGDDVQLLAAPWDQLGEMGFSDAVLSESMSSEDKASESALCAKKAQNDALENALLELFKIDTKTKSPKLYQSYKPFVLLFDEFYTDLYRMSEAEARMQSADRIIFMGTSFSVNITQIALHHAMKRRIPIEVVDPKPVHILYPDVVYHCMTASEYVGKHG